MKHIISKGHSSRRFAIFSVFCDSRSRKKGLRSLILLIFMRLFGVNVGSEMSVVRSEGRGPL